MGTNDAKVAAEEKKCGLIMPISPIDGCTAEHWAEVKSVLTEALVGITEPKLSVSLVSDADDIGVIQKRIVQNVYTADIVVCDVSGKNPNVMFELGMRLAFDKPTVIVKDDKTDYAFDTGVIEHIGYPRDLRFARIVAFKKQLQDKVVATLKAAAADPEHSTFLKSFGKFQVAKLSETVVTADQAILEQLAEIQAELARIRRSQRIPRNLAKRMKLDELDHLVRDGIATYSAQNGVPREKLVDNEDFHRFMEDFMSARDRFDSRLEFIEYLETQLKHIVGA